MDNMKRATLLITLLLFVTLPFSFAQTELTQVANGGFESVTSYTYTPYEKDCGGSSLYNYYTPFTLPNIWEFSCDWENSQMLCDTTGYTGWTECFSVTTEHVEGDYAYLAYWLPNTWNEGIHTASTEGFTTLEQDVNWANDDTYVISGYYKTRARNDTDWVDSPLVMNSSFASFELRTDAWTIDFNLTPTTESGTDGWKYFEMEYDEGACSVLEGDINVSFCTASNADTLGIYSYWEFNDSNNVFNLTELNEAKMMLDDLEVKQYETVETLGVSDYYDTYLQSLDNAYASYEYFGIKPEVVNLKIYSGKIMDSMKTRFLNITFDTLTFVGSVATGYSHTTYINKIEYFDEDDDEWKQMNNNNFNEWQIYNPFCRSPYSCFYGGNYGSYPLRKWQTATTDTPFYFGLIMPKEAQKINISFTTYRVTSTGNTWVYASLNFTLSDNEQSSQNEIDTSNAVQDVPTFFPVLVQYISQNSKNLTSYHLNLVEWLDTIDDSRNIYWESQLMNTFTVSNIIGSSYDNYTYDSSVWGIQTDDDVWYNATTTETYFNETFRRSSYYAFDSPPEDIDVCQSHCEGSSYYELVGSGFGYCDYEVTSCSPNCLPTSLDFSISPSTTEADVTTDYFDEYYYSLYNYDTFVVVETGTSLFQNFTLYGLSPETTYRLTMDVEKFYGCYLPENLTHIEYFDTPTYSDVPVGGIWGSIVDSFTAGGNITKNFLSAMTVGVGTALGINEVIVKTFLWFVFTAVIILGVVAKAGDHMDDPTVVALGIGMLMLVVGLVIGWVQMIFGVILISLLAIAAYFKMTR